MTGKMLTATSSGNAYGAAVSLTNHTGRDIQWAVTDNGNGCYVLWSKVNGYTLTVKNSRLANLNEVYLYPQLGFGSEWELSDTFSVSLETQLYLDAPDMILPMGLKEIEEEAFVEMTASVVICPDDLQSIGARAFANCPELRQIYIPESCVTIDVSAFEDCRVDFTIYGIAGSAAEQFANEYGYTFVALE